MTAGNAEFRGKGLLGTGYNYKGAHVNLWFCKFGKELILTIVFIYIHNLQKSSSLACKIFLSIKTLISTSNCMFLGQFAWVTFLKTNEGYLSQIALKNIQLIVNYTLLLL